MNKWKKILGIQRHVPRSSYILRVVVGGYLLYLSYQIIGGLGTESKANPAIMITAAVLFGLFAIFCLLSGGIGLYQKEYREAHVEDQEEALKKTEDEDKAIESRGAEADEENRKD